MSIHMSMHMSTHVHPHVHVPIGERSIQDCEVWNHAAHPPTAFRIPAAAHVGRRWAVSCEPAASGATRGNYTGRAGPPSLVVGRPLQNELSPWAPGRLPLQIQLPK